MWSDACHWWDASYLVLFFIEAYMCSYGKLNLQCVEERMRGLISNLIRLSKQVSASSFLSFFWLILSVIKLLWILHLCSELILRNQDTVLLSPQMFNIKSWQWTRRLGRNGIKNRLKQRGSGDLMKWVPLHFMRCKLSSLSTALYKHTYYQIHNISTLYQFYYTYDDIYYITSQYSPRVVMEWMERKIKMKVVPSPLRYQG